jgi:hypothetical protein
MDLPVAREIIAAAERAADGDLVLLPTLGGSLPLYLFTETLAAPVVITPIANHDDNQHAPNENLRLANLWYGIDLMASLFTMPAANTDGEIESLDADDLTLRQGCDIELRRVGPEAFAGATHGKECGSSLRGATYATSEVLITPDRVLSWDRGFDAQDRQVWGAEGAGYIFDKQDLD